MSDNQKLILVDEKDNQIGIDDKMTAHRNGGKLHRAFSVFLFNSKGQTLIQQRASGKYHEPMKWTNTCCSHPFPNETTDDAAHRRLKEELGMDCDLNEVFSFTYKEPVGNNLTEWEYDHVFFGTSNQEKINFNKEEVNAVKWIDFKTLQEDVKKNNDQYTPWFKIILERTIREHEKFSNSGK